jgi:ribonuclease R
VHITELGGDYFQYDEARHELRGERTGKRYQLTDRVTVQVSRVDLEARKIDLVLAGAEAGESGAGKPKSAAAKALDAKPGKSREPKVNTAGGSRYDLDPGVDGAAKPKGAKAARPSKAGGGSKPAGKASKTNKKR